MARDPTTNETAGKDPASVDQTNHHDLKDSIMSAAGQTNTFPLFAALPAELRLLIYEQMFEGSKASYKRRHTVGSRTQLSVLVPTYHCNFLLTCHQAYNEALKIYWSKTTLYGDPDDRELLFFLRSIVPNYAKLHVKHIRGLNSHDLRDRPVDVCLKDYQKLQTVGFEEKWILNSASLGTHRTPPTMEEWVKKHCKEQSRRKFSKLLCDSGPAVVCRGVFRLALLEGKTTNIVEEYENELKVILTLLCSNFMPSSIFGKCMVLMFYFAIGLLL